MKYYDELGRVVVSYYTDIFTVPENDLAFMDYDEGVGACPEIITPCFDTLPEVWY